MNRFYETVVKYDKEFETGEQVKVQQQFLIDALSCTEGEARTLEEVQPYISGAVEVVSVKVSKYTEFVPYDIMMDTDRLLRSENSFNEIVKNETPSTLTHYGVKVNNIIEQENGKIKKNPQYLMVAAISVEAANDTIKYYFKDALADFEIASIVETKIVDVIIYDLQSAVMKMKQTLDDNNMTITVSKL